MELINEFRVGVPVARAWTVLNDVERIAPCLPGAQLQEIDGDEYRGVVKVKVGPITVSYKGVATFLEQDEAAGKVVLRAEGRETRGQGNATATVTATMAADGDVTVVTVVTDLTVTGKVAQFGRGVMADVSGRLIDQFVECLEAKVLADDTPAPAAGDVPARDVPVADMPAGDAVAAAGDAVDTPTGRARSANGDGTATALFEAAAPGITTTSRDDDAPALEAPGGPTPVSARRVDSPEPETVDLLDAAGAPLAKRVAPVLGVLFVLWLLRRLFGGSKG